MSAHSKANGKMNGKMNGKVKPASDMSVDDQTKVIDAELGEAVHLLEPEPVQPTEQQYKRAGRNWKLYRGIDWRAWWSEFSTELTSNGHRKYRSVWHFICKKTPISWQRQALKEMIGPPPEDSKQILEAPYLGDWEKRRKNECYVFEDLAVQVKHLELAIVKRTESMEAVRALAPMVAQRLMYWYRIRDKVNEAFANTPLTLSEKVTSAQQKQRAERFFEWMENVESIIGKIEEQWMKIHGVNPLEPGQQLLNAAMAGAAGGVVGAAMAGAAGRPVIVQGGQELPLPEGVTYDGLLFAQMLGEHGKTYELPLPDDKKQTVEPVKKHTQ